MLFTWSIIRAHNVAPLYMVPQKIPIPRQDIIVAIRDAYGTLAMHSLHMFPKQGNSFTFVILLWEAPYIRL